MAPGGWDKALDEVVPLERRKLAKGKKKTVMRPVAYAKAGFLLHFFFLT